MSLTKSFFYYDFKCNISNLYCLNDKKNIKESKYTIALNFYKITYISYSIL